MSARGKKCIGCNCIYKSGNKKWRPHYTLNNQAAKYAFFKKIVNHPNNEILCNACWNTYEQKRKNDKEYLVIIDEEKKKIISNHKEEIISKSK